MSLWGRKPASFPAIEIRPRSALQILADVRETETGSHLPETSTSIPLSAIGNAPVLNAGRAPPSSTAAKPRRYQCSLCSSAFARAEHLARHERSHRNERPFACKHCEARFTRQDLIKRHVQRHHNEVPGAEPERSSQITARDEANSPEGSEIVVSGSSPSIITTPSGTPGHPELLTHSAMGMESSQQASGEPAGVVTAPQTFDMDTYMTMDFGTVNGGLSPGYAPNLDFRDHERSLRHHACRPSRTAPIMALENERSIVIGTQRSSGIGSREISVTKRAELVREIGQVLQFHESESNLELPSCIMLEGCLTICFHSFLCHMPCIHMSTWRAEDTHPTLLLSMIAIGLIYQARRELANDIHRAARLSIIRHLESSIGFKEKPPIWVLQALLFIMVYGTWAGDPYLFQDGIALQSRLAHMARSAIPPTTHDTGEIAHLDSSWEEWAKLETFKRTIFMVYTYFNILSLSSNIPPALLSSEIDLPLPCPEPEWIATRSASWAEYHKASQKAEPVYAVALQSLLSPTEWPLTTSYSEVGGYIVLHAILQRIWYIRQASAELSTVEIALERWQATWTQMLPGDPFSPLGSYTPVAMNSNALLRLAYIRLVVDFPGLSAALTGQNITAIAHSMASSVRALDRCPASTKAAFYAIDALRTPIKLGLYPATKDDGVLTRVVQQHLVSMECCLFLSKWLTILSASNETSWTVDEESLVNIAQETLGEIDLNPTKRASPLSAQVMYAWAAIYGSQDSWGIISIITASALCFADSINSVL